MAGELAHWAAEHEGAATAATLVERFAARESGARESRATGGADCG
jgi:hypothetical protein